MWSEVPIALKMRRISRSLLWMGALALLFATGCPALSYISYRVFPDYPADKTETLELPGLQSPVRVHLEELGVPHIEAENETDLLRAVGFLHGRARFFQMDIVRRYARGRLCELVGEQQVAFGSTVTLDTYMRSWGFEKAAEAEVEGLEDEFKELISAYVEGINTALEQFEPVEYRLLEAKPEPWAIADSFAVGYIVAWGITHNWQHEVCRLLLALQVGHERAERIFPPEPWPGEPSLKAEGEPRALPPSVPAELEEMFPERPYTGRRAQAQVTAAPTTMVLPEFEGASNGWVVGGERTSSGMPIVAGDPHLPHTVPSMVFQQHLRCPELEAIGMTIPGVPYVLWGHNRRVAWTITAAMADVVDLYIERADLKNPGQVLGPEGPEPIVSEEVVVRIREGSRFRERTAQIRHTPRGPLFNDMYPDLLPEGAPLVSVHMMPMGAGGTMRSLRQASVARDVHELRSALIGLASPTSTVSAADTNGEITLFATGSVPVRKHHRGTFPCPAWIDKYKWTELARPEDIPHGTGSGRSFFVNTNNLMVEPARREIIFHVDSAPSYRRDRVVEMIEATDKHTFESMAEIQGDVLVLRAKRVAPTMLEDLQRLGNKTPIEEQAIGLLANWDYRAEADSAACAIFFSIYREAIIGALEDEVTERSLKHLLGFRYFTNCVDLWFKDPNYPVWDDRSTVTRETRADVVCSAFARGVRWLKGEFGSDSPQAWKWGEVHTLDPEHPLGSKVDSFNLPRWKAGGASASVWKTHFDMSVSDRPFQYLYGPVLRLIVDFADMDHAKWVVDTGSSGWPHSPHYGDQHELWKRVEFAPMVSDWEEIKKNAAGVITLRSARK